MKQAMLHPCDGGVEIQSAFLANLDWHNSSISAFPWWCEDADVLYGTFMTPPGKAWDLDQDFCQCNQRLELHCQGALHNCVAWGGDGYRDVMTLGSTLPSMLPPL